jgi:phosphoglycerate dehydrogenase-like enzyme
MAEANTEQIQVVVAMDFPEEILDRLRSISDRLHIEQHFPDVPVSAYHNVEILYTLRHFPEPAQAPHLRWIQLHYAGMDRILHRPIVKSEDVEITSASGIHAVPITEYCIGMMLAWEYQLPRMLADKREGTWPENPYDIYTPRGLRGRTLGIAGYGSIGRELARVAQAMGMRVLATKRDLKTTTADDGYAESGTGDPTGDIPDRLYPPEALGSMVSECDFVVITTPLTEATYHMVNESILKQMGQNSVLINIARGSVVDEAALVSALAAGEIGGAVLDVFEEEPLSSTSPLWNLDNVIISPHVAGNSQNYHERAAALFEANLRRYLSNEPLFNRLDRQQGY